MRKNKVHHNGSAEQARDTIKDFQDGKDDAAAAVIQKSWRRHTERKMKNELTSRGVPEKKEDKKRPPLIFPKTFSILSFDGGGSMGIMELLILKDVMNLATILVEEPSPSDSESSRWRSDFKFEEAATREQLREELDRMDGDAEVEPIHPGEVFDMIVGGGAGALMSFALVGGNRKAGRRAPMALADVIKAFEAAMPSALSPPTGLGSGILNGWSRRYGFLWRPYSLSGWESQLGDIFGGATLGDFNHLKCVAGAAALRCCEEGDSAEGGGPELFDTRSVADDHAVAAVLKAAADTPIYFETPTTIAGKRYVDVGASGHSPLGLALPRMRRLRAGDRASSVLCLSAPSRAADGNQGRDTH